MADRSDGRSYRMALSVLGVGAVLLLVGFALPWATAQVPLATGVDTATRAQDFTGRDLFPAAAASGWVCLAGLAGILATRSWGRIAVGLIVAVAGLAGAAVAVAFAAVPATYVDAAAGELLGSEGTVVSSATGWWALCLLGGLLSVYAGAWTVLRGRRWPTLGSRYERTPRAAAAVSPWDALDKGEDPTADLVE